MFGIPFEIGYACWQFGQTIVPSSMWIWTGRGGGGAEGWGGGAAASVSTFVLGERSVEGKVGCFERCASKKCG